MHAVSPRQLYDVCNTRPFPLYEKGAGTETITLAGGNTPARHNLYNVLLVSP